MKCWVCENEMEFFKNDFYINKLENLNDIESYKSNVRDIYNCAIYRWNMTILPHKLNIGNWIETNTIKIIDVISNCISKIIE